MALLVICSTNGFKIQYQEVKLIHGVLQVANLVEAPVPLIGKFKESFLELPEELLTIVSSFCS